MRVSPEIWSIHVISLSEIEHKFISILINFLKKSENANDSTCHVIFIWNRNHQFANSGAMVLMCETPPAPELAKFQSLWQLAGILN